MRWLPRVVDPALQGVGVTGSYTTPVDSNLPAQALDQLVVPFVMHTRAVALAEEDLHESYIPVVGVQNYMPDGALTSSSPTRTGDLRCLATVERTYAARIPAMLRKRGKEIGPALMKLDCELVPVSHS